MNCASLYTLREAEPGDEAGVQHVVDAVLREYGMMIDTADTDRDLVDITASYASRGVFKVLVDKAGRIVGCGGLYPLSAGAAELRKMYLIPVIRGLGLGRTLLQMLIGAARLRGIRRVSLKTKSVMTEAIALYRRNGFIEIECTDKTSRYDQAFTLDPFRRP
jgi:putative acetyltransferase